MNVATAGMLILLLAAAYISTGTSHSSLLVGILFHPLCWRSSFVLFRNLGAYRAPFLTRAQSPGSASHVVPTSGIRPVKSVPMLAAFIRYVMLEFLVLCTVSKQWFGSGTVIIYPCMDPDPWEISGSLLFIKDLEKLQKKVRCFFEINFNNVYILPTYLTKYFFRRKKCTGRVRIGILYWPSGSIIHVFIF